jgi:hypothetical protein
VKRLAVFALLAFALAGCGGSGSSESSGEPPVPTNTTDPPKATATVECTMILNASTSPQSNSSTETSYLTNVVLQHDDCMRRVAFELDPSTQTPGYEVSYEPADTAKIEDGSGNPVEIAGDAFLVVKLKPAMTAKVDGDQVTKTYTGPRRLAGTAPVTEVVKTGDFEGVVTWVIGLDTKRPFIADVADGRMGVFIDSS